MKILAVISGLGFGGAETQLMAISGELTRRGHEVIVYLLTDHAPRLDQLLAAGVEVIVDNKRIRLDPGVLRRLRQLIHHRRPDVVHGYLYDGNWYATVAAIGLGVPVLCAERSSDYRLSKSQWLGHWPIRRFVSGVVANSERGRMQARDLFGMADGNAHVVWNGLDLAKVDQRVKASTLDGRQAFFGRSDVRLLVVVGSLYDAKDQLLAVQVFAHLHARDGSWRMVLVGASLADRVMYSDKDAVAEADSYEGRVRHQITSLGLDGLVQLVGQRRDALEIIANADVLLSTSKREGSPNVVLEAMAVGTPVVATDFSDIRRLLPQPWQVVTDRNPASLADAVLKAHVQTSKVATEQRQWIEAHATIEIAADQLLGIYKKYTPKLANPVGPSNANT